MPISSWLSRWSSADVPNPIAEAEASRLREMSTRFPAWGLTWAVLTLSYGKAGDAILLPHSIVAKNKDDLRALVLDIKMRPRVLRVHFERAADGVNAGILGI